MCQLGERFSLTSLSLEPHLFDFVGFADLEQAAVSIKTGEGKKLTGLEAFTLAHSALLKILET